MQAHTKAAALLGICVSLLAAFSNASSVVFDSGNAMKSHARNSYEAEEFLRTLGLGQGVSFEMPAERAVTGYPFHNHSNLLSETVKTYSRSMRGLMLRNSGDRNWELRKIAFEPTTATISLKSFFPAGLQMPRESMAPGSPDVRGEANGVDYHGHFELTTTSWTYNEKSTWNGKRTTLLDFSMSSRPVTNHYHVIAFDPVRRHIELATLEMVLTDRKQISIWVTTENGEDFLNMASGRGNFALIAKAPMTEIRRQFLAVQMDDPQARPKISSDEMSKKGLSESSGVVTSGNRYAEFRGDAIFLVNAQTSETLAEISYTGAKPRLFFEGASFVVEDVETGLRRIFSKSSGRYGFIQQSHEGLRRAFLGNAPLLCKDIFRVR